MSDLGDIFMTADALQLILGAIGLNLLLQIIFEIVGRFRGLRGAPALTSGIAFLGFGNMTLGLVVFSLLNIIFGFVIAGFLKP